MITKKLKGHTMPAPILDLLGSQKKVRLAPPPQWMKAEPIKEEPKKQFAPTLANQYGQERRMDEMLKRPDVIDAYLLSKEQGDFGGDMYSRRNMAGSSAYGKYQIMPDTAKAVIKKHGLDIPFEEWAKPENQERIYDALKDEYIRTLEMRVIDVTPQNVYAVHQLGTPRALRLFGNKLNQADIDIMRQNLPKQLQDTGDVVGSWKSLYLN
jgi:hypothetical protein